jgi:hypothetical protein
LVDKLAKHAAEIALRLAALPPDGLHNDIQALDAIDYLALEILKEVSVVRARIRPPGDRRGIWPEAKPVRNQ